MAITRASTPQEYIDALDEPRKSEIVRIDKLIRETMPDLEPVVMHGILGYGPYHYKYKSGHQGDTCVICLGSKKNYISIHCFGADCFKERLPKADIGVACVRFKRLDDLDQGALKGPVSIGAEGDRDDRGAVKEYRALSIEY